MFDSGVGGLSIFQEVTRLLPNESILYFADTLHCPYGEREPSEVAEFSEAITRFLLKKHCKLIVVACNTATAMAIDALRRNFPDVPFVGMEPAIKPAALKSRTKTVGVLATTGTFHGRLFQATRERFAGDVRVLTAVGTGLVELVEAGYGDSPEAEALLRQYLTPMLEVGMDRLVLGCTHYAFLSATIWRVIDNFVRARNIPLRLDSIRGSMGNGNEPELGLTDVRSTASSDIELVMPGEAVALRVRQLLKERGILVDLDTVTGNAQSIPTGTPSVHTAVSTSLPPRHQFYASGPTEVFARMAGAEVIKVIS